MALILTGNATEIIDPTDLTASPRNDSLLIGIGAVGTGVLNGGDERFYVNDSFFVVLVGENPGGDGTLTVDGVGTTLTTGNEPSTGNDGSHSIHAGKDGGAGLITVQNGGTISTYQLEAGRGADGTIRITGEGSLALVNPENGSFQDESSDFADGGFVRAGRDRDSNGDGVLDLDGEGLIEVLDGGELRIVDSEDTLFAGLQLGRDGGDGTVRVSGEGSLIFLSSFDVGDVDAGSFINVGRSGNGDDTGDNLLLVENLGETRLEGSEAGMSIARDGGAGSVLVRDGGAMLFDADDSNFIGIGRSGGAGASMTVTGDGSTVTIRKEGRLTVGDESDGTLVVNEGADIVMDGDGGDSFVNVGFEGGSTGDFTLTGEGSTLSVSGGGDDLFDSAYVTVGSSGEGRLRVLDGADVTITAVNGSYPGIRFGAFEGSNGVLELDGVGSTLIVNGEADVNPEQEGSQSGYVAIGREGDGTVTVSGGGVFQMNGSDANVQVGREATATGDLTVTGDGSMFDAGSYLEIAGAGAAEMTISDGGTVVSDFTQVNANGRLDGDGGVLESDITVDGGTIAPGESIGTLTIDGTLLINTGSLETEIEGFDGGLYDVLDVTGAAEIADASSIVFDIDAEARAFDGARMRFLTADGGVSINEGAIDLSALETTFGAYDFSVTTDGGVVSVSVIQTTLSGGGTAASETLIGAASDDVIDGGAGADIIEGFDGNDMLTGGRGADIVRGRSGDDEIGGGAGVDILRGGAGDDVVYGDAGGTTENRQIQSGDRGEDTVTGGSGADIVRGGGDDDTVHGGLGADIVSGDAGDDTVSGGGGDDIVRGGGGNDQMSGGDGDDRLTGDAGDDVIAGDDGDDVLIGAAGADTLDGGAGDDILIGGGGADRFVFSEGVDIVRDFQNGTDQFDISAFAAFEDIADVLAAATTVANGVRIDLSDTDSVLIRDRAAGALDESDFIFAG